MLKSLKNISLPEENKFELHTYHTFVIKAEKRDYLKKYLDRKGISTKIHYPHLIFDQMAYKKRYKKINPKEFPISVKLSKEILTLPINQYMKKEEIKRTCDEIKNFYKIKK